MSEEEIKRVLETAIMKVADDNLKKNADTAENVGMEVTVTRRYDGVGLSGGRECKWCLSRCGEDMPYREAKDKGAFERHPGCGCEIDYITEKGIQRQTDWKTNTWTDVRDDAILKKRKTTGLAKQVSAVSDIATLARTISEKPKMLSAYTPKGLKKSL